jgi:hypothetical protein
MGLATVSLVTTLYFVYKQPPRILNDISFHRDLRQAQYHLLRLVIILVPIIHLILSYLIVRHHLSLPTPPYTSLDGTFRVLSSQRSLTGRIVVAEDLERRFRFLRADASILGGRWFRDGPGIGAKQAKPILADS